MSGSRRARRLASSLWLPWAAGVLALLTIAGAALAVGGRVQGGVTVPTAVLDSQQQVTVGAAQHVRRAVRASELDLGQLAAGLSLAADTSHFDGQLKDFRKRYGRYQAVYVLDTNRQPVARAGGQPHPERVPERPTGAGSSDALAVDRLPVVIQHAPFTYSDGKRAVVVAEFDLASLKHAFDAVLPATAWVVDARSEVLASTSGFTAFQKLGRAELRRAAAADRPAVSLAGGGSVDAREIVASAPVRDGGRTPGPSWRVVTARSVNTVLLPETQARDQAKLAALAVAAVAVAVFGWLYVMWLRPLRRLVGDAERIADGELRAGVEVRRHDELGQVAGALEQIRLRLVKAASDRTPVH